MNALMEALWRDMAWNKADDPGEALQSEAGSAAAEFCFDTPQPPEESFIKQRRSTSQKKPSRPAV
jgi:hypothetical protein